MCFLAGRKIKTGTRTQKKLPSIERSTVCVLVVVVVVVRWVFSLLETLRVSPQGQQFISQQGGGEGRG